MSANTNHVAPVSTTLIDVIKDIDQDEKRRTRNQRVAPEQIPDSVKVESRVAVAKSAEASHPKAQLADVHRNLVEARASLEKQLKSVSGESGGKMSTSQTEGSKIEDCAAGLISSLEAEIASLSSGGDSQELARKESQLEKLKKSLGTYQGALGDAEGSTVAETGSVDNHSSAMDSKAGDESAYLGDLSESLKALGLTVDPKQGTDAESLQADIFKKVKALYTSAMAEKTGLEKSKAEVLEKLNGTQDPEEKVKLEGQLKTIETQLAQAVVKIKAIQTQLPQISSTLDGLLQCQVRKQLGVSDKERVMPPSIEVQSSSSETQTKTQPPATLQTRSVSEEKAQNSQLGVGTRGAANDTTVHTESAEAPILSTASDMATTFSIQSTASQAKNDAKKEEKLLKELLAAAASGNWEAVKSALILLDKRASKIVTQMGSEVAKSMVYYEQQMQKLSQDLGKINFANDTASNAKLQKISSDMNMYSLRRQSDANLLRDFMTMREEVGNLTHSVLDRDSRIVSAIAR